MKRSFFDMSHDRKLTCAFNDLIPIFMEDTLPGDTFSCTTSIFIRLAPQLNPVMADLRVHVEFFFIPNRLLWRVSNSTTPNLFPNDTRDDYRLQTRWEDFITGFQSYDSAESAGYPDDRDPYPPKAVVTRPPLLNFSPLPYYGERKPLAGSLYDYLYNIPPTYYNKDRPGDEISARGAYVCALPVRAYNAVWNEWYRDPDLQPPIPNQLGDGDIVVPPTADPNGIQQGIWTIDSKSNGSLLQRNWEKDYFTTCRPWQQKGEVIVHLENTEPHDIDELEAGQNHPHMIHDMPVKFAHWSDRDPEKRVGQTGVNYNGQPIIGKEMATYIDGSLNFTTAGPSERGEVNPGDSLYADLQTAGLSLATFRNAFQAQKWMERSARYGSRYGDALKSHFGVFAGDSRLDRPEFLGGGKAPVVFSEVLSTAQSGDTAEDRYPLGEMGGHAISAMKAPSFHKSFTEHGWVLGLMSIVAKTSYQQGVPRRFTRESYLDYMWPEFVHLAEQPVFRREIYATSEYTTAPRNMWSFVDNRNVFGFAPRYDEYRRRESSTHGEFRELFASWHLGRIFPDAEDSMIKSDIEVETPFLNSDFITAQTSDRIFSGNAANWMRDHYVFCHVYHHFTASRLLPKVAIPGFADHF